MSGEENVASQLSAESVDGLGLHRQNIGSDERPRSFVEIGWALLLPLAIAAAIVGGWQLYVTTAHNVLVPTPASVASGFILALQSSSTWAKTGSSWISLAIGYSISAVAGITLGILLGWKRGIDKTLGVYVDLALVTPEIVLMPILLVAFGVTRTSVVMVIIMFSLPYVIMPIRNGVRAMPQAWLDLSRSFRATRIQTWRHIIIPGAREMIGAGLRIGLGHALTGLLVVELTLVALGIGQVIIADQSAYKFGAMFGYIVLVMCQVFVIMGAISFIELKSKFS